MKFFALILSFYLLALGCFPCGDSEECNAMSEQNVTVSSQHQEHEHQTEACTPFCSCACCAAAGFYQPVTHANTIPLVFQQLPFYYIDDFNSHDFHYVWQPPKIS